MKAVKTVPGDDHLDISSSIRIRRAIDTSNAKRVYKREKRCYSSQGWLFVVILGDERLICQIGLLHGCVEMGAGRQVFLKSEESEESEGSKDGLGRWKTKITILGCRRTVGSNM